MKKNGFATPDEQSGACCASADVEKRTTGLKRYIKPSIGIYSMLCKESLFAASPLEHAWTPDDATVPPIDVKEEGPDGSLGEEGSEITGAKGNLWNDWDY